jgi:hypothetical protein
VTADGVYDGTPTCQTIARHGDGIEVMDPPCSTAVPSGEEGAPTQRDRHLAMITEWGRLARLRGFADFQGVHSLFINELDGKVVRGAKVWARRHFFLAPARLGQILYGCAAATVAFRAEPSRA